LLQLLRQNAFERALCAYLCIRVSVRPRNTLPRLGTHRHEDGRARRPMRKGQRPCPCRPDRRVHLHCQRPGCLRRGRLCSHVGRVCDVTAAGRAHQRSRAMGKCAEYDVAGCEPGTRCCGPLSEAQRNEPRLSVQKIARCTHIHRHTPQEKRE
jgi:hypothetical protein